MHLNTSHRDGRVERRYWYFSVFSLSLSPLETARYRLKYCLKGPLNQKKKKNQPSNTSLIVTVIYLYVLFNNTGVSDDDIPNM